MIDSSKLLSRTTSKRQSFLSRESVTNLIIIKRDTIKIDGLLKERLVLSKVREGILKQRMENEMRRERERNLEARKETDDESVSPESNKKPKSILGTIIKFLFGGFLKLFKGLFIGILPRLPFLIKTIAGFSRFFLRTLSGSFRLIGTLVARGAPLALNALKGVSKTLFTALTSLIRKGTLPLIVKAVNTLRGLGIGLSLLGTRRAITGSDTKSKTKTTVDAPSKLRAQREITKTAPKDAKLTIGNIYERFGEEDRLTRQGRRITKGRELVEKSAITGFVEQDYFYRKRTVVSPRKGEREASQKILESFLKKQNKNYSDQLNLALFLDDEPTRINDKNFKNLLDRADGKISGDELDARILREKGLNKVDLDNIKLGDVRQRADITKILNKSVGTKTKARKLARKQRNINKIIKPKKGEVEASQKLIENLAKKTPASLGKKGLSKILFNVGGEALEQSVKQSIKASIGVIPILGDLIGVLLDVYLFGEEAPRAIFKGIGSFALGALLGGVGFAIGGPIGTLLGSIIGGIGGDILGGIAYDLFFGKKVKPVGYSTITGSSKEYLKGVSKARTIQKLNEGGVVREYEPPKQVISDRSSNLQSLAFYEKTQVGREVMIPIPIPINNNKNQGGGENIVIHSENEQKRNSFSQLYRRG